MIEGTIEKECKAIIRAARGTGREQSITRAINTIYLYAANIELELIHLETEIGKLAEVNEGLKNKVLEDYAQKTVKKIYDNRKAHTRR